MMNRTQIKIDETDIIREEYEDLVKDKVEVANLYGTSHSIYCDDCGNKLKEGFIMIVFNKKKIEVSNDTLDVLDKFEICEMKRDQYGYFFCNNCLSKYVSNAEELLCEFQIMRS